MGDFDSEYADLEEWMIDLGLINLLKEKYGSEGPYTCSKSKDSPIDCIFGSPHLLCQRGGILSFGQLDSDHRGIYLDLLRRQLLYGFNPPAIVHPNAHRLKTNDPRIVNKYLSHLTTSMHADNLFQRMNEIHTDMQYPLSEEQITEYEEVSKLCGAKMYEAEK